MLSSSDDIFLLHLLLRCLAAHSMVLTLTSRRRSNQLFRLTLIGDELPLGDMGARRNPHLILELAPLLALFMLKLARRVQTRIKPALSLHMSIRASLVLAVGAVATNRCCWVAEGTALVGAVGEELAVLLGVVCELESWGWVFACAFAVHAGCAESAHVGCVDGSPWWCCRPLVRKFAVLICAGEVESACRVAGCWLTSWCEFHI